MNPFSEKVNKRKTLDREILSYASRTVYNSLGDTRFVEKVTSSSDRLTAEVAGMCAFFKIEAPAFPSELKDAESVMQYLMAETGIMRRKVVLTGTWWKNGSTPLLCFDQDEEAHILLPGSGGGYVYCDADGVSRTLRKEQAKQYDSNCYCFYKPFPNRSLTLKDFHRFLCGAFGISDVLWLLGVSLIAGFAGMIMPAINKFLFHNVVPSGTSDQIFGICVVIFGTVIITAFLNLARTLWVSRIGNKLELLAQNAIWSRLMTLPVDFFKQYESGDLTQRAASINQICAILGGQLIPTVLGSLFSFLYLFQISRIAPEMFLPSLITILLIVLIYVLSSVLQIRFMEHNNEVNGRLSGTVFQLLNGITKIKVSGSESRAFSKWAELYAQLKIMPDKMMIFSAPLTDLIVFGGTILLYFTAFYNDLSASDYIAFNSAFSLFTGAVMSIAGITSQIASLRPSIELLRPLLEQSPENAGFKQKVEKLAGDINIDRVKFRYQKDLPYILNDMELHIRAGEYIGIVGSSGCGKSTLLRVLLGFERPESGTVYYDSKDMDGLDLRSVRRRIGVVLQNGKLFAGDVYSNIVITAPWLTVDEAWIAAEKSGLAEDIRNMPMGMFTMVSEGGGGLSGGQQQRLLIARALASDPDIVMFDEATSALDNITQAMVVSALEQMQCTRIVIAHRLSTIRNCSRIVYLDHGQVVEQGSYEELMQLNGKFAELAKRQLV